MANLALYKKTYSLLLEDMALSAYRKNLVSFNKMGTLENKIDPVELAKIKNLPEFLSELISLIKEVETDDSIKPLIGPAENFITDEKKYKVVSLRDKIYNALSTIKIIKGYRTNRNKIINQSRKEYGHKLIDNKIDVYMPFTYEANQFLSHSVLTKPGQPVPTWCIAASDDGPNSWAQYKLEKDVIPNVFIFVKRKDDNSGWEGQKYEVVFPNGTASGVARRDYPATAVRSAEWRHPEQTEEKNYWHFTNNFRKVFPELPEHRLNRLIPQLMDEFADEKSNIEIRYSKITKNIRSIQDCINVIEQHNFQPIITDDKIQRFKDYNIDSILSYIQSGADISPEIICSFLNADKVIDKNKLNLLITTIEKLYGDNIKFIDGILTELTEDGIKNLVISNFNFVKRIIGQSSSINDVFQSGQYLVELGILNPEYFSNLIYKKIFYPARNINSDTWLDSDVYWSVLSVKRCAKQTTGNAVFYFNLLSKICIGFVNNENDIQNKIYQAVQDNSWLLPVVLNLVKLLPNLHSVKDKMFNVLYQCGLTADIEDCLPVTMLTDSRDIVLKYFDLILKKRPEVFSKTKHIKKLIKWYSEEDGSDVVALITRYQKLYTDYSPDNSDNIEIEKAQQIIAKIKNGECTDNLIKELFLLDLSSSKLTPYIIEAMNEINEYVPIDSKHKISPDYFLYYLMQMPNESEILQNYSSDIGHFIGEHYKKLIEFIRYLDLPAEWTKAVIDIVLYQLNKERNIDSETFEKIKAICLNLRYMKRDISKYFYYQLNLYKQVKMKFLPYLTES